MNHEQRITKIETVVETFRGDNGKLFAAIDVLRLSISELRDHMDQRFTEERKHVDQSIAELRSQMDHNFREVRREASVNLRWLIGLMLANTSLIIGAYAKMFGLY